MVEFLLKYRPDRMERACRAVTTFLFTTLPTNDLGLLTRSLPVARELSEHGHSVRFCSPASAPSRLIADAGFENLLPRHPLFDLMATEQNLRGLVALSDAHPNSNGFIWWKPAPQNLPSPVSVVNRVLGRYGLASIRKLGELCVGDLTLVVGTPETDPLPAGSDVTYVGPILWQKQGAELPGWIRDRSGERLLIWVYSGNPRYASGGEWLDSAVVLQACIAALGGENMEVVLTTGHHELPKEMLPLPGNFRHEPYLPGLAMAEQSDLLIHHGGYGSCQTGLFMGKPAVILPTFSERESNARRVAALGAGLVVPVQRVAGKKHVSSEATREAVRKALADPSFTQSARRIGESLRQYGGASEAARLIEQFSQRVRVPT